MNFIETIDALLKGKGVSANKMAKDLGFGNSVYTNWKNRGTVPSGDTLQLLADYFDVSVDYLLGRTDDPMPQADPEMTDLLQQAKDRPEIRALFSLTKNATTEDVEKTIDVIKVLRGSNPDFNHNDE